VFTLGTRCNATNHNSNNGNDARKLQVKNARVEKEKESIYKGVMTAGETSMDQKGKRR
jgi:hypothetical protein